jgi:DnaJ family protein C protein 2
VFEREARFSRIQPVPLLGAPDAGKVEVEQFYDFWYNFDSWRSFEYLDKEVNEGSDKCVCAIPPLLSGADSLRSLQPGR